MRRIRKVAVLGSGVMGSAIACHFANIGMQVLLLDILPKDIAPDASKAQRNSVAKTALDKAVKSSPAPLYKQSFVHRISIGNMTDDLASIGDYDWIMEVVIERLDIKKQLFEQVDKYRRPDSLVTSNTSGIPIHLMAEGRSENFRANFCGTHFFNPPRYLPLLEIIPSVDTKPEVISFLQDFGAKKLGKQTVLCKDTPAFIGNRIGVYAMARIFELSQQLGLPIDTVDKLTGPAIGRPKTGTFRLGDLVGMDTAFKVIEGIKASCPDDKQAQALTNPNFMDFLMSNLFYGDKSGKGFYQKTKEKDENGRPIILALNLDTLEYGPSPKLRLESLGLSKQIDNPKKRIPALFNHADAGGQLIRASLASLFSYSSNRIPEISDTIYGIDDALKAGFAWDFGPFEYWDLIGIEQGKLAAEAQGESVANWVDEMLSAGLSSFYKIEEGIRKVYNPANKSYEALPGAASIIHLDNYRQLSPVYQNEEVILHDIGDGVLCLEFISKMNTIGGGVLQGIQEAINIAESGDWQGLVIGNNAKNFTVGANLMMVAMAAYQQEWDELNMAVHLFQETSMRCRYSSIPVVAATQGYVFGGGCEIIMHCDATVAAAESYIGLVEVGVGIIPGGGGTKEFAVRLSDTFYEGDIQIPNLIERFKTIATASVASSAYEAFDLGYLNQKDQVVTNTAMNISEAKKKVLELAQNYTTPIRRTDVMVLGQGGLGALYTAANTLYLGKYASEHDIKIARKIAWVLCGGDLSGAQMVSEKYLLDLEREAFLSLCGEQKTLERIQFMLENGKPLRN